MPDPQTLFTVIAGISVRQPRVNRRLSGRVLADAGRADVAHYHALRRRPGLMPDRSTAALIAAAPRSGARSEANPPRNRPTAVRAAPTITVSFALPIVIVYTFPFFQSGFRFSRNALVPFGRFRGGEADSERLDFVRIAGAQVGIHARG